MIRQEIVWKDDTKGTAGSPRVLRAVVGCMHVMVRQYAGQLDTWYTTIREINVIRYNLNIADEVGVKSRAMMILQTWVQTQIRKLQEIEETLYMCEAY